MRKLYEIFKVLKVQKITVSAETIRGNTVVAAATVLFCSCKTVKNSYSFHISLSLM